MVSGTSNSSVLISSIFALAIGFWIIPLQQRTKEEGQGVFDGLQQYKYFFFQNDNHQCDALDAVTVDFV